MSEITDPWNEIYRLRAELQRTKNELAAAQAAISYLSNTLMDKDKQISDLEARVAWLESEVERLEALLGSSGNQPQGPEFTPIIQYKNQNVIGLLPLEKLGEKEPHCLNLSHPQFMRNGVYDQATLDRSLHLYVRPTTKYVILDWEGEFRQWAWSYATVELAYEAARPAVEYIRRLFPDLLIGIYAQPDLPYPGGGKVYSQLSDQQKEAEKGKMRAGARVLSLLDFASPNLYDGLADPSFDEYAADCVSTAIDMAGHKPVYPWLWHRVYWSPWMEGAFGLKDPHGRLHDYEQMLSRQILPAENAGASRFMCWDSALDPDRAASYGLTPEQVMYQNLDFLKFMREHFSATDPR